MNHNIFKKRCTLTIHMKLEMNHLSVLAVTILLPMLGLMSSCAHLYAKTPRHPTSCRRRKKPTAVKNIPNFGEWADGHLLLHEHGSAVSFQNIKLRELSAN
jgi:hypothetical protein